MLNIKQNNRISSLLIQCKRYAQVSRFTQDKQAIKTARKVSGGLAVLALFLGGSCISMAHAQSGTTAGMQEKMKVPKDKAPKKSGKSSKSNKVSNVVKRIVVVFPVDAKGTAENLSDIVTDVEKARLSTSGLYSGISFLTSLPSVRRSVNEQSLTQTDILPPYAMRTKAQKLTMAAGYDVAIVSSLDSYEYSADNQNVTMVLTIQMIDFSGATPKNYTAADTVTTAAKSAKNATDTTAAEAAARALAEKLMTSVLNSAMGTKPPAAAATTPAPK